MPCTVETVREAELGTVRPYFPRGTRVLELGGGTGYQASLLASWGCEVESLDVHSAVSSRSYFPVRTYDGRHLPFPDSSFDRVFTSNVLEHVEWLDGLLHETRRVLRANGLAIHILPTTSWRFWTSVAHYVYVFLHVVATLRGLPRAATSFPGPPAPRAVLRERGLPHVLKRALLPGPHGAYSSALHELYTYSGIRWCRVFRRSGFAVKETFSPGVFYAGYGVIPQLDLSHRRTLSRVLGSACRVFVLTPVS